MTLIRIHIQVLFCEDEIKVVSRERLIVVVQNAGPVYIPYLCLAIKENSRRVRLALIKSCVRGPPGPVFPWQLGGDAD